MCLPGHTKTARRGEGASEKRPIINLTLNGSSGPPRMRWKFTFSLSLSLSLSLILEGRSFFFLLFFLFSLGSCLQLSLLCHTQTLACSFLLLLLLILNSSSLPPFSCSLSLFLSFLHTFVLLQFHFSHSPTFSGSEFYFPKADLHFDLQLARLISAQVNINSVDLSLQLSKVKGQEYSFNSRDARVCLLGIIIQATRLLLKVPCSSAAIEQFYYDPDSWWTERPHFLLSFASSAFGQLTLLQLLPIEVAIWAKCAKLFQASNLWAKWAQNESSFYFFNTSRYLTVYSLAFFKCKCFNQCCSVCHLEGYLL